MNNCCIRRFTFASKPLLNLIDPDIGRPISNIRLNIDTPDLEQRVQQVIETMVPELLELQDRDGHWYALRLRHYKTMDNHIEGAVLTFIGIGSIKNAQRLQQELQLERCLAAVVRDSNDAVTVQDFAGRILAWNRRGESVLPCENWRRAKDGCVFKVLLSISALLNENGNPSAIALTERGLT